MLRISYGELFLIVGATAALVGPKDLPIIARAAGRLAGRAIGYVQKARGQFDTVMQQSQASQVHKELQDTIAQLEAIRYEVRSLSIINPGPLTRRLDDAPPVFNINASVAKKPNGEYRPAATIPKIVSSVEAISFNLHSQATTYAKLAEASTVKSSSSKCNGDVDKLNEDIGLLNILPVSAESAGLVKQHTDESKGSDIVLEAILEAEVARNAKNFFSRPENQIPKE